MKTTLNKPSPGLRPLQRLVSLRAWISPKGGPDGDDDRHKSCFGFAWWFWIPTVFHQKPVNLRGFQNARDIRLMWCCFCVAFRIGYDGPVSPKQANHMDVRQNWRISGAGAQKLTGEGREV